MKVKVKVIFDWFQVDWRSNDAVWSKQRSTYDEHSLKSNNQVTLQLF